MSESSKPASLNIRAGQEHHAATSTAFAHGPFSGWEPRHIRHRSDVMTLPSGAVVMSAGGIVWQLGKQWYMVGCADPFPHDAVTLPAKVLFEGDCSAKGGKP